MTRLREPLWSKWENAGWIALTVAVCAPLGYFLGWWLPKL